LATPHKWAKLVGEGLVELPVKVCVKCGAFKVGNTVKVTGSYVDFALLTANPSATDGRVCYNSTDKKIRHYDGTAWRDWM